MSPQRIGRNLVFYAFMLLGIYAGYRIWGIWGAIVVWRLHPYYPYRDLDAKE